MLTVSLLGTPAFTLNNQPVSHLVTGRAAALLIYLAVTRQPQSRARLADLLWENLPELQAKTNLRYRLSDLRKVVGDYVVATGETVAFNQDLPHWVDVTAFTTHMATIATPTAPMLEPVILQELLKLYTGEFLTGFLIDEAPVFERWLLAQRRYYHDLLVQGLQLGAQQHLAQGEYAAGLALNHDLLTWEPWREEAHRQRMLLLAHSGQRSAALQQYTRCCQSLAEELDVPPMPETTALYETIKSGHWFAAHNINGQRVNGHHMPGAITAFPQEAPAYRQNGAAQPPVAPPPVDVPATPAPRFDLGAMPHAAHFYGRDAELATLHSWIGQEHSRLVALLGLNGQGKTALAAAFVQDVIEDEQSPAHGFSQVIWRSLSSAPPCIEILQGWLQQLDAERKEALPSSFDELITRLFTILQTRRCLLVLDGVDALLASPTAAGRGEAAAYHLGCEEYTTFFRLFFQRRHRSCLLLTSRSRPAALTQLDERNGAFHTLAIGGLPVAEGTTLLAAHGIVGTPAIHQQLHHQYVGNPQLLSQAANLIHELFGGDGSAFLQEGLCFLGNIGAMLAQQVAQFSALEQQILHQLAQAKQPLTRQTLWTQLTPTPAKPTYFRAIQRLQGAFLLQPTDTQVKLADLLASYLAEQLLLPEAGEAHALQLG